MTRNWVGPVRVQAILDDTHYLCSDWTGKLIPKRFHINRLKQFYLNLGILDEDGMLQIAENTRQLFKRWSEIQEDTKPNGPQKNGKKRKGRWGRSRSGFSKKSSSGQTADAEEAEL